MQREQLARALEGGAPAGTQEAVPADLRETARQDVLEKAREKTVNGQRDGARLVGGRARVPKGDTPVGKAGEPLIRQGHAIDVAREIERRLRAGANLLHVDGPPAPPDAWIDLVLEARARERGPHPGAEEGGERVARNKKPRMCGPEPRLPIGGEAAGGDEQVRVGMIFEGPRPRVQDREDADRAAHPAAIIGERLHRGGGFAQEGGIDDPLVRARDDAKLVGESKCE